MDIAIVVFSIVGALLVGTMSPGPSFVVVARISLARSRRAGLAAALGMGLGGVVYGTLALLGLHILLAQVEWLYLGLKVLGGSYLIYLAFCLWRDANETLVIPGHDGKTPTAAPAGFCRALLLGLTTQLSNPKTAVVYSSIFAAFLPANFPLTFSLLLLTLIFLIEAGWYGLIAVALSARGPRGIYLRAKSWVDRLAGSVMGLLGVRLIADS